MTMTKDIRIGLIGAGYIADWHADALAATPGVRISAICDPRDAAARALARQHGAETFTTVDSLIAANACDAVHILTPPNLHESIAIQCLSAGLHTLVEKPVAESAEATRRWPIAQRRRAFVLHRAITFWAFRPIA